MNILDELLKQTQEKIDLIADALADALEKEIKEMKGDIQNESTN